MKEPGIFRLVFGHLCSPNATSSAGRLNLDKWAGAARSNGQHIVLIATRATKTTIVPIGLSAGTTE
jgi:hypothetical protein